MLCVCLQKCTWLYAYEDSAVSRNWKIHFRSIQQAFWQYSRDDSPLHSEQITNPWCRTHVSPASCHWAVALANAFLLHHSKTVSECTVLCQHVIVNYGINSIATWSSDPRHQTKPASQKIMLADFYWYISAPFVAWLRQSRFMKCSFLIQPGWRWLPNNILMHTFAMKPSNAAYILLLSSHLGLCLPCDLFHLGPSHLFITRMQCL